MTLDQNQGKGGAVKAGIKKAHELGFSHAIQIDADGQHDLEALPLTHLRHHKLSRTTSDIRSACLRREWKQRRDCTGATRHTFGMDRNPFFINCKDSMCGFRAYPIKQSHCCT
ncbi:hypothetical protein OK016_13955 [Vibrio chagasii]|nr:hypothetical protein [Vibrio chagasii]